MIRMSPFEWLCCAGLLYGLATYEKRSKAANVPPEPGPTPTPPTPGPAPVPIPPFFPTPTEAPKPRAPAQSVQLQALHRYRFVVDVLPVVGLRDIAERLLPRLGLGGVDIESTVDAKRGDRAVTRATFQANMLTPQIIELEREQAFAGIGSIWIVSAEDVTRF
jgi:hypothetical protein